MTSPEHLIVTNAQYVRSILLLLGEGPASLPDEGGAGDLTRFLLRNKAHRQASARAGRAHTSFGLSGSCKMHEASKRVCRRGCVACVTGCVRQVHGGGSGGGGEDGNGFICLEDCGAALAPVHFATAPRIRWTITTNP